MASNSWLSIALFLRKLMGSVLLSTSARGFLQILATKSNATTHPGALPIINTKRCSSSRGAAEAISQLGALLCRQAVSNAYAPHSAIELSSAVVRPAFRTVTRTTHIPWR
ncbi:hypothetical protein BO94DRAFT_46162 [Aspergillus sclerotioniger CBS 115572]|uniref:Secreted protein n=1 Tax=Aspergillus sclerotioniger CBS 115572 TaxID=1450535 RepID=A0A317WQE6_9EURO|nr:hypothetical protein BO94DRAFT_46162 [Aspergillus sclerotioniger CBS 115572]PWY88626.1 hypothetical protein BO94DRAFT_46162 [Aspergillus sclerotioniger CBS 115572]